VRQRAADAGLLLLRLGAFALIVAFHVRPKLAHFDEEMRQFPDPLGIGHAASFVLALLSEGGCALLIAAGVGTRAATLPIVFTMATVLVLRARGFEGADVQSALLYALPYAALALLGPGAWSIDARLSSRYEDIGRRIAAIAARAGRASS
jgi:putative oxidoreductase